MTVAEGTRPRLAVSWNSGCGGCEAAFLDLGERLFEVESRFELVYFPLLIDSRLRDLESRADGTIDVTLLSGAIRGLEDVLHARLMRRKSKVLVAIGACAQIGSVLALADMVPLEELLRTTCGSACDVAGTVGPTRGGGGGPPLRRPGLCAPVQVLEAIVPVDFSVPGCPPELGRLCEVLETFAAGALRAGKLSAPGDAVLGVSGSTVCEDCSRKRPEGRIARFRRPHEVDAAPDTCLLDAGLVCSGPATRGGCGAPCPAAGAPCRGCYGGPPAIDDQGTRMLGALAAAVEVLSPSNDTDRLRVNVEEALDSIVDPVGTLYRYCLARSLLARLREPEGHGT